ncbi:MAG: hypothetical protein INR73_15475 [Williamsia sp.]|nr:hypothetical protein [Williamsia sp.]
MKQLLSLSGFLLLAFSFTGCQTLNTYQDKPVVAFIIIAAIVILFLVLAVNSNILREVVNDSDAFQENGQKLQQLQKSRIQFKYPYSLSRVQFGIWTVIISSSYIYLSLCKGDCANIPVNKTALVLMGIYSGLAAASTLIDKREINDSRPRHQNTPSQGFFVDILSDDNGISLHRFQNLVWSVIAVVVYLYKVAEIKTGCILPELSDTLLALTGLSTATYLVLRTKENDPPALDAAATPPATANQIDSTATGAATSASPLATS